MKVLVINTGSSSIKYQLFTMEDQTVLAHGIVERIGEEIGRYTHVVDKANNAKTVLETPVADHKAGLMKVVDLLTDPENGVVKDKSEVDVVGHRVVHGGEAFQKTTIITDEVIEKLKENIPLAPLHNPPNIIGINVAKEIFTDSVQVGVFDTAFHHTIPKKAFLYALPYDLYKTLRVRRYGFHGTSHHYVTEKAAEYLNKPVDEINLITVHLGNGGSVAAVKNGKSIDTSMGMTPLEGLIMGTRSGDIDPALPFFLAQNRNMSFDDINDLLNKESGLKGICGINDMREIVKARENGDKQAILAMDMYAYRIKKYIGSFMAIVGKIDAIVFTAGIGEHSHIPRRLICQDMEHMGICLDSPKNDETLGRLGEIQSAESKIKLLIVPTNEELKIALESKKLLDSAQ